MRRLLILGPFTGLIACTTPGADVILSLSEDVQTDALRACHTDLGVTGPFVPQKLSLDDGRVSVFAAGGNGVSLAEARSVNRCARERLLATYDGTGTSAAPTATPAQAPVTADQYTAAPAQQSSVARRGGFCEPGSGVLQGGSGYCIGD